MLKMALTINKYLTKTNYNTGSIDRIKYLVIHYVGATGGAYANCQYYAETYRGASAHYFVGFDGEIWQSVEDKDIAWHCGASSYVHPECRNANSIGIEMCVRCSGSQASTSKDWYFEDATVESAIALTRELMGKYNIDSDHVIRHYDVTGKICGNPYVYNNTKHTWDEFKAAISQGTEGWVKDSAGWWWRNADGSWPAGCWQKIAERDDPDNVHWYYFGSDGYMETGLQEIDGKWYLLEPSGALEGALMITDSDGALHVWYV